MRENQKKVAIVLGIAVLIPMICLALVMLSIKFYLLGEISYQKFLLTQDQHQYQTSDFLSLRSSVAQDDKELTTTNSFYQQQIDASQVLQTIAGLQFPQNLYLTNVSLQRDQMGNINATISGISDSRDDLLLFQKNIEANQGIKNPYFSPDSWVNPGSTTFHLTFQIGK